MARSQEYMAWYFDGEGKPFAVGVHGFTEAEVRTSQTLTTEEISAAAASGQVIPALPQRAILEPVITSDQNGTR